MTPMPRKNPTTPDEVDIDEFLANVGQKVRQARETMGISRRKLAEISGISQRYLAQLETGQGNISIGLLFRLSRAIQSPVEHFLTQSPNDADTKRVIKLLRAASPEKRQQAIQLLDPNIRAHEKRGRIALIGLRGAGKSTLGRLAAQGLKLEFLELNDQIETRGGMPSHEIIALYGQEGFRLLEHQAVETIAEMCGQSILAVAGGIVSQPATFEFLLANFHTIWLRAKPDEHMARVQAQGDLRPMAGSDNAMAKLRAILSSREGQYARATESIDTSGKTVRQSAKDVIQCIRDRGFLTS